MHQLFRRNNFDLLRLIAALQVVVYHACSHMRVGDPYGIVALLHFLPGVPIFFFVSGYLISKSYEANSVTSDYARNRAFRIYPALIVCTFLSVLSVGLTGYLATASVGPIRFTAWVFGQMTIAQFYSPDFMRGYGCGVLNGSLWTITVEVQFYVLVPMLYLLLRRLRGRWTNALLIALIVVFACVSMALHRRYAEWHDMLIYKLVYVTFIPYFHMFLIGILFQRNFEWLHARLRGRVLETALAYGASSFVAVNYLGSETGNTIDPICFVLLAMLVFACAYTAPDLSNRLLRKNDISYGVYIYHMPIINLMLHAGAGNSIASVLASVGFTVVLAILSWILVEKPCLQLKKRPLNPLHSDVPAWSPAPAPSLLPQVAVAADLGPQSSDAAALA